MNQRRIEWQIKKIIYSFLPQGYQAFLFGSRVTGKGLPYSDFDVGVTGPRPLSMRILAKIREAFEESNIPVKIDVVDFRRVSEKFKKLTLSEVKQWREPN